MKSCDWARMQEAAARAAEALGEMAGIIVDWAVEVVKEFGALLGDGVTAAAAYAVAKHDRPDWVYKAKHCKKRRVRKKYHDKIMRTYGGK